MPISLTFKSFPLFTEPLDMTYPIPVDEQSRLAVLAELTILDTSAERPFDLITEMARDVFGAPMVAISLVAKD